MTERGRASDNCEFDRQMALARQIMDDHWMALRALALSYQHPEADVETLLRMAREQGRDRSNSE